MKRDPGLARTTSPNQLATRLSTACVVMLPLLLLLALPAAVQAQFTFTTNNGVITITGYTGSGGAVTIPSTTNGYPVTSIGAYAFESAGLTSVIIPDSVTSIGDDPFGNCESLTAITMGASNSAYSTAAGVLFNKSHTTLVQYPAGKAGSSYTIPNSITSVGIGAFDS
jgi:hypothetical protein